jgi:hypothetical protein
MGAGGFGLGYCLFDGGKDELAGGAAFLSGQLMEAAVEVAGEVYRGADGAGMRLHVGIVELRLK